MKSIIRNFFIRKFVVIGILILFFGSSFISSIESDVITNKIENIDPPTWWDNDWCYRKQITIEHTMVNGNLQNFPVLVHHTSLDLTSNAQQDGDDFVFTTIDGIKLSHEIEKYNNSSGELVAWVNVTSLSSETNTILYMYYGNPSCENQEKIIETWNTNFVIIHHLNETNFTSGITKWHKYEGNPILIPDPNSDNAAYGTVLILDGLYHKYYCNNSGAFYSIDHATSYDGINWTKDTIHNPVFDVGIADWENMMVYTPMVWIEDDTWYMIYTGRGISGIQWIGLATSSDGLNWIRNPNNPVLTATKDWEINGGNTTENFGVIKVDDTYYLAYQIQWHLEAIASSTDLVNWEHPDEPQWTGGRFCGSQFKYGDYFYHLTTHEPHIELFRSTDPMFPDGGDLIKIPISTESGWDSHSLDTPYILTHDIYKDTFPNDELWCYYSGNPGIGGTSTGLTIEKDIGLALDPDESSEPSIFDSTTYGNNGRSIGNPVNIVGVIDGAVDLEKDNGNAFNCGDDPSLELGMFTIEAWAKLPDITSIGSAGNGWLCITQKGSLSTKRFDLWTLYGLPAVVIKNSYLYADISDTMENDTWTHVVGTFDGTTARIFVNGLESSNLTGMSLSPSDTAGADFLIGDTIPTSKAWWEGCLDEVRVSNIARRPEWISTTYNNQNNPDNFLTFGEQEGSIIKLGLVKGGLFKISAIIKNMGGIDANNVNWSIVLSDGLIFIGRETTGTVDIQAQDEVTVKSKSIFGFGNIEVMVSAEMQESSDIRTQKGMVFLFFIKVNPSGSK